MTKIIFEKSFYSDIDNVRPVIIDALSSIKLHFPTLSNNDESDIRLILSELLYNATIHGNRLASNKIVYIRIEVTDCNTSLCCIVSDEGGGFDHRKLVESYGEQDMLESEHGRGIRLAIALADKFTFNSAGNEIVFCKKVVYASHE